jgi:hypothetical protein
MHFFASDLFQMSLQQDRVGLDCATLFAELLCFAPNYIGEIAAAEKKSATFGFLQIAN